MAEPALNLADNQNDYQKSAQLRQDKESSKRENLGKGIENSGKAMRVGGLGAQTAGKGIQGTGKAIASGSQVLNSIPLVGQAAAAVGTGIGKTIEAGGRVVNSAGKKINNIGNKTQDVGEQMGLASALRADKLAEKALKKAVPALEVVDKLGSIAGIKITKAYKYVAIVSIIIQIFFWIFILVSCYFLTMSVLDLIKLWWVGVDLSGNVDMSLPENMIMP